MIDSIPRWIWAGTWLLAFIAGIVNTIGYLSFEHQAITHMTGTASMLGIAMARSNLSQVLHLLAVIGSFGFGAVISGLIIKDDTLQLSRSYSVVLLLESLLLAISVQLLNQNMLLGTYLAGMACGLQNAMASSYSGAVIRTSHLTGMFTDLGIFLGHRLRGKSINARRFYLCHIVISAFIAGAVVAGLAFPYWGYSTLYLPAALTTASALTYALFYARKSGA